MATMVHVIAEGYHPHNTWELRPDGLYELAGAARALTDTQVRVCTQTRPMWEDCACWDTAQGHVCPLADCAVMLADRTERERAVAEGEVCGCAPGTGLGCEAPVCVIDGEPRFPSPYGVATLGFSLD